MYYEKLALEVGATVAGFNVLKPPVVKGASGVEHRFTFAASDGPQLYTFDVYPQVSQIDMIRTYVKKMDTGAKTYVVSLSGKPKDDAEDLAKFYDIEILGPKEIGDFFSNVITQKISVRKPQLTA